MKNFLLIIFFLTCAFTKVHAQQTVHTWHESDTKTVLGKRVVGVITNSTSGSGYKALQIQGTILDKNTNFGHSISYSSSFTLFVQFIKGGVAEFKYRILQDTKTPNVKLFLYKKSADIVEIVADCNVAWRDIQITLEVTKGNSTFELGDPESIVSYSPTTPFVEAECYKAYNGNISVGAISKPSDRVSITSSGYDDFLSIERLHSATTGNQGNKLDFRITSQPNGGTAPLNNGSFTFVAEENAADFSFITNPSSSIPQFIFNKDGRLGIGLDVSSAGKIKNASSSEYRLYVNGGVLATKVKVELEDNWPDYVFAPTYKLMPLSEVEQYITANKHLPDVPSAEEVATEGIDVATMDATLLQKIEELTLYTIEQQKQLDASQEMQQKQQALIEAQQQLLLQLQKQVESLQKN